MTGVIKGILIIVMFSAVIDIGLYLWSLYKIVVDLNRDTIMLGRTGVFCMQKRNKKVYVDVKRARQWISHRTDEENDEGIVVIGLGIKRLITEEQEGKIIQWLSNGRLKNKSKWLLIAIQIEFCDQVKISKSEFSKILNTINV